MSRVFRRISMPHCSHNEVAATQQRQSDQSLDGVRTATGAMAPDGGVTAHAVCGLGRSIQGTWLRGGGGFPAALALHRPDAGPRRGAVRPRREAKRSWGESGGLREFRHWAIGLIWTRRTHPRPHRRRQRRQILRLAAGVAVTPLCGRCGCAKRGHKLMDCPLSGLSLKQSFCLFVKFH